MQALRAIANSAARTAVRAIVENESVYRYCTRDLFAKLPLSSETKRHVSMASFRDALFLLCEGLVSTPYGAPLQFKQPFAITIGTSNYCPFQCGNCYSSSELSARTFLPREAFEAIARLRSPYIFISGGEPMLDPQLEAKLAILLDAGKRVNISTNMSIAPLEKLAFGYPGQIFPMLPVWGLAPAHDSLRGQGSFQRLIDNIEISRGWPAYPIVYAVLRADNDVLSAVLELGARRPGMRLMATRTLNVGRVNAPDTSLSLDLRRLLGPDMKKLSRLFCAVTIEVPESRAGSYPLRRFLAKALLGIGRNEECGAANWMMHLDAEQNIRPCFAFEQIGGPKVPPTSDFEAAWAQLRDMMSARGGACAAELQSRTEAPAHV